ncbi:tRNA (5-methylaminomethyl-2-thiouridine)(34)-methyltransferase MnmD [Parabacteroides pacaensis]|uniref:tRNA (5-methylaminomethyl-2-thiouridine)(34)-methyltransferase MnmD n=1 Tax=Parabacteroides pacaensis TaxID=2086575 RepID=UPI000D0ED111|nr:tRNA (5-methylaminomethyl-2-thiouridine)(34)-methyltransferase MnmD [Parabacteroides pacaensis]
MATQETENSKTRQLQITADGSHTLYIPEIEEHYHSINGAVQESRHVFINAGWKQISKEEIRILEIGFGTGLNAFLTLLETLDTTKKVTYSLIELYPLERNLIEALNYPEIICPDKQALFYALHDAPWNCLTPITSTFTVDKIKGNSNTCELPKAIDLVYFDAFAPDKQPEMWNQEIFNKLYAHSNPKGILTTYCAKGSVRRMMQSAGYAVERIPGPPGKREMLRASKK